MKKIGSTLCLFFLLSASAWSESPQSSLPWGAIILSGAYTEDDSNLENWDRARENLHELLIQQGFEPSNIQVLTSMPHLINTLSHGVEMQRASKANLFEALNQAALSNYGGVFLYMTSHGSPNIGFLLESETEEFYDFLSVGELKEALDTTLGDKPLIIGISACYSGQFIHGGVKNWENYEEQGSLKGPNRVLFTAASRSRSSFGCGSGSLMPEWDDSFIKALAFKTQYKTWGGLYRAIKLEIDDKEKSYSKNEKSLPQYWAGSNMKLLDIWSLPQQSEINLSSILEIF